MCTLKGRILIHVTKQWESVSQSQRAPFLKKDDYFNQFVDAVATAPDILAMASFTDL